jgi:hypothetical protein
MLLADNKVRTRALANARAEDAVLRSHLTAAL